MRVIGYAEIMPQPRAMPWTHHGPTIPLLAWCTAVMSLTVVVWAAPTKSESNLKADRHGDPMPDGVVARYGSVRFRGEVARAPDGKSMATFRRNRAVLIDADSGTERLVLPGPDPKEFEAWQFALSPDGQYVAYGGPPIIEIWSVRENKCIGRFVGGHGEVELTTHHGTRPVAFSPDGKSLLMQITGNHGHVGCWDVAAGEMRWRVPPDPKNEYFSLGCGFANLGQHVVVLRQKEKECQLQLLRVDTGEVEQTFDLGQAGGHGHIVWGLAPTGEEFAFLEQNEKLRRLELPTGRVKPQLTNSFGDGDANAIAYSVDGKKIAVIDFFLVRICDTATGNELGRTSNNTTIGFGNCRAEFSNDGRSFWIVHQEEQAWQRFDGFNGRAKRMTELGHRRAVSHLAISPDGKWLATACDDDATRLWNAATCQPTRRSYTQSNSPLGGGDESAGPKALVFHPNGKDLIGAAHDSRIVIFNPETGMSRRSIRVSGEGALSHLALSPDAQTIAVAQTLVDNGDASESLIRLFDYTPGKEIRKFPGIAGPDTKLSYSPDGRWLAAASSGDDGSSNIVIVEAATGRVHRTIAGDAHMAAFTNQGYTMVYAAPEGIMVWELASGSPRLHIAPPQNDNIDIIAVSPDGTTVVGANHGAGTRRIYRWDLRTGESLPPLIGHDHYITALAFAQDGRLLSGSQDTTALVWEARKVLSTSSIASAQASELPSLWVELTRGASEAHRAVERLIAAGDTAVRYVENHFPAAKPVDRRMIEKLVDRLDAGRFAERQRAIAELEAFDTQAEVALRRIYDQGPSAEARRVASRLLERLDATIHSADLIRGLRVVEILHRIGSPAAVEQLQRLANGDPAARVTKAAREARGRFPTPAPR